MQASVRVVPADVLTPIGAYTALAEPQSSCLLESVESGGRISRYSFIGLDYRAAASFESTGDLYDRVRSFAGSHRCAGANATVGGALLAFSYDAARFDARLPARVQSPPDMPAAYAAIPGTWLIFDHFTDLLTIWCSGDDAVECERRIDGYVTRLLSAKPAFPRALRARSPMTLSLERDRFLELVGEVKRHIYEGDIYQLQLGIRFGTELEGSAFDVYRALRRVNPSPYMFFIDTPFGELLGASPEFLVRLEGRRARIRPLAGTRWRGRDDDEDARIAAELLANEKERAEHVMLVDLGRNDLGRVARYGTVQLSDELTVERYSHVMHLCSTVTGRLQPGKTAFDALRSCLPAGTLSGAPKVRAMEIIDELEPHRRGPYGGAVGYVDFSGNMDTCIALRTLVLKGQTAYLQAGAGIVADSIPANEYEETLNKARGLLRALEMAEKQL
jgi:anthranilate synthase component I